MSTLARLLPLILAAALVAAAAWFAFALLFAMHGYLPSLP